jgi:hypothetical protein
MRRVLGWTGWVLLALVLAFVFYVYLLLRSY